MPRVLHPIRVHPTRLQSRTAREDPEAPLVTIAIPAFNRPGMLAQTLESIAAQTERIALEVIVCDDGRLPETEALVARYPSETFRYARNERSRGPVGNWNECLRSARGKWVMVLHEDDALYPWYFEFVLPCLASDPVAVCMRTTRGLVRPEVSRPRTRPKVLPYPPRCFLKSSMTPFPGVLIRRDVALRLGGFDESWGPIADYEFWYRLSQEGRIDVVRAVGAFYRVAPGQWTQQIWGRMLRLAHLLRLRIAREQFSEHPSAGRWLARYFTFRNAQECAARVGTRAGVLRRCLALGKVPFRGLPNGWVWEALKIASRTERRHPRTAARDTRTQPIQQAGGGFDRLSQADSF